MTPLLLAARSAEDQRETQPACYATVLSKRGQHPPRTLTHRSIKGVSKLRLNPWRDEGKNDYADWFEEVYLTTPWNVWYVSAAGHFAGVLPSHNPIEAFHRTFIASCVSSLRANTATVLNDSLPGVLTVAGMKVQQDNVAHYCEGSIIAEYMVRAWNLLSDRTNFVQIHNADGNKAAAVVFNVLGFVNSLAEPHKCVKLTPTGVKKYTDSLRGKLVANKPLTEAKLLYQSLHRGLIHSDVGPLDNKPTWQSSEINLVTQSYQFNCSVARQSGWICEHIVATVSLLGKIDVDSQLLALPVCRRPGGQFKRRGALVRDHLNPSDVCFFGVGRLEAFLMEELAVPINWQVIHEFDFTVTHANMQLVLSRRGCPAMGVTRGRLSIPMEKVVVYDTEEMGQLISFSHSLGVKVIP